MPHARGDEPIANKSGHAAYSVCPTHVGMNREIVCFWLSAPERMPHARGDEPLWKKPMMTVIPYAPRTWG